MNLIKKGLVASLSLALLAGCATSAPSETTTATSSNYDKEVDYLVLGGGVAGLSSAIEAADLGLENILLLEKTGNLGGAAFYSGGIFGGLETQITKANDVHYDIEDVIAEQMAEKHYILDEDLTRLTIEKAGETIDWLIDEIGVKFQAETVTKDGYGTFPIIHLVEGEGAGMKEPFAKALEQRENIEVQLNTSATELIVEDGKVVGAVAVCDGQTMRIKADAVLLATGGYSANHDLFVTGASQNGVFQTSNFANQSGDGLVMATKVGAGVQNLDQLQVYLREYNNPTGQNPYMFTIFVGQDGKRFMDEKRTAQTYNQEIKDDVIDLYGRTGVDYFWSLADEASLTMMGINDKMKDYAGVVYADTLEELAVKIGVDAATLVETVNQWNQDCANQKDSQFNRTSPIWFPLTTGPYYALQTTFFSSVCHGGITKNANAQVTRIDGTPIDGLFAAGEVTTVTNSNGYTISNAITFGRIAANSALKYMNGELSAPVSEEVETTEPETLFDMSTPLIDGEYEASVEGQEGKMIVKTTITDGKIANVEIVEQHETEGVADNALATLPQAIVDANSVDVDAVSGASLTSGRIQQAVVDCLTQAAQ